VTVSRAILPHTCWMFTLPGTGRLLRRLRFF